MNYAEVWSDIVHHHRISWVRLFSCLSLLCLISCAALPSAHISVATPTSTLSVGTAIPIPLTSDDWPMYHANSARTGYVAGMSDPQQLARSWSRPLDGAVYAEPLVVAGRVIVATENDTLYSLDARTGKVQWQVTVGTPVPLSDLPCGDIDPLGITGTPVYDPRTGLVFAVAETKSSNNAVLHQLVGIDAMTGQIKVRRLVDPPGINGLAYQERGALALLGNMVYVAFGGLAGDCGNYRGLVVASHTDGTGPLESFQVPTAREGGIWATPGPVIDQQGSLYVAVGNGASTQGSWDHSDSILRLSPELQLQDAFAPASWPTDNATDFDLGSMGPVLLPGGALYADGKSGKGYLLQADQLGGVGGQLQTLTVCSAYGGAAVSGPLAFIPCDDGLRQIQLAGTGSGAQILLGWQAQHQVTGSPVIGGNTVYSLDPNGGTLYAINATTGEVRATVSVGITSRFATPTLYQESVFVGTMQGIVAVRVDS